MSKSLAAALTACIALCFASQSLAQQAGLPMKITLKTIRDGVSGLEQKAAKTTLDAKDVFLTCAGVAPTKNLGLIVAMDCGVQEDAFVAVYDRGTDTGLAIGGIDFDYTRSVITTVNGGAVKSRFVPFELTINCGADLDVVATGVAEMTLRTDGDFCPTSIKGKFSGTGDIDPFGELLIDNGSSFSSSKPFEIPQS